MIAFEDRPERRAHDEFQGWRRANPAGLVLNCKTGTAGMLHLAACSHFGTMDTGADAWGSLTKRPKVCSTEHEELRRYAKTNHMEVAECPDCKPA
jgi:hypothetical protein